MESGPFDPSTEGRLSIGEQDCHSRAGLPLFAAGLLSYNLATEIWSCFLLQGTPRERFSWRKCTGVVMRYAGNYFCGNREHVITRYCLTRFRLTRYQGTTFLAGACLVGMRYAGTAFGGPAITKICRNIFGGTRDTTKMPVLFR